MSTEEAKGIVINAKTISAMVGMIAILTMFWTVTSYFKDQQFQIVRLKEQAVQRDETITALGRDLRELNGNINELTIAINSLKLKIEGDL